jgi:hypothetical protein
LAREEERLAIAIKKSAKGQFDKETKTTGTGGGTSTPTPPGHATATPVPVVTLTPTQPIANPRSLAGQENLTEPPVFTGPFFVGYPELPGGHSVTLEGGTFIGNNPYLVRPSYGPKVPIPGLPGWVMNLVSLANTILRPEAYGQYLNSEEPNVSAQLSFSQSSAGTLLQRVSVQNDSGQPLKVTLRVTGSGGSSETFGPMWVLGTAGALFTETPDGGSTLESGLGLFAPDESTSVRVGIVATANDPPLLRDIEFYIPSSETSHQEEHHVP